jgi:ERCC4-type nuclease
MTATAILVDAREPQVIQNLKFNGTPTVVQMLEHGDCMVATDDGAIVLIERKTSGDLLNSLGDGRLFVQLSEMLSITRYSYLVITGELQRGSNGNVVSDRGNTGWSWASVQGALLTAQEMGIFVTFAGGEDYETCVLRLAAREHKEDLVVLPAKLPRTLTAGEAIIAALPGIGPERMKAVLDACGSPAWALVALTDSTSEIQGIPHNVKIRVRGALKLQDAEQLGVMTNDRWDEVLKVVPLGEQ